MAKIYQDDKARNRDKFNKKNFHKKSKNRKNGFRRFLEESDNFYNPKHPLNYQDYLDEEELEEEEEDEKYQ